jgi:hypothetical protein
MKLRVEPRGRPLSPFVEGGFGLFRLTAPGVAGLPDFYRRRMAANDAGLVSQSFTDPLLQAGCGLNVFASRHLAVQPVIEVLAVRGGGRTYAFAAASARVAWHFEDHPVTFGRR